MVRVMLLSADSKPIWRLDLKTLNCRCPRVADHCCPVARPGAAHCPACMRVRARPITHTARAGAPCHAVSRNALPRLNAACALAVAQTQPALARSAHTRMPSYAHTSPALKIYPSVCSQCLQRGRCRCQPRRTVTRGLLRGRVPAVLRGHHRVLGR